MGYRVVHQLSWTKHESAKVTHFICVMWYELNEKAYIYLNQAIPDYSLGLDWDQTSRNIRK